MKKILLVEDNSEIIKGLKYSLNNEKLEVAVAKSIKEANDSLNTNKFDLVILDVMLPDGSGFDLLKRIEDTPVIFLTAKDDEDDIVSGLEMGAEDYVTKPFKTRELISRITRILKRNDRDKIVWNNIAIDLLASKVYIDNIEIFFTPLEYRILVMLFSNLDKIMTREVLLDKIWDIAGNFVNDNTLTVYIKRIREKLNMDAIKTIKGIGYRVDSK